MDLSASPAFNTLDTSVSSGNGWCGSSQPYWAACWRNCAALWG